MTHMGLYHGKYLSISRLALGQYYSIYQTYLLILIEPHGTLLTSRIPEDDVLTFKMMY